MNAGVFIGDCQFKVIGEGLNHAQRLTKFMYKFFQVPGMNIQEIGLGRGDLLPGNSERRHVVHSDCGALRLPPGAFQGLPFQPFDCALYLGESQYLAGANFSARRKSAEQFSSTAVCYPLDVKLASAKGADARRDAGKQLLCPWRGALDPAPVLRVLLRMGLWRSWERASMAWKRSRVRISPGLPVPSVYHYTEYSCCIRC